MPETEDQRKERERRRALWLLLFLLLYRRTRERLFLLSALLAPDVSQGLIDEWRRRVEAVLLDAHATAHAIGRLAGESATPPRIGPETPTSAFPAVEITPDDYSVARATMEQENAFLTKFAWAIAELRYSQESEPTDAIDARIEMYLARLAGSANRGLAGALPDQLVYWRLDVGAEHCGDCIGMAAYGAWPVDQIPFLPGEGRTECLFMCRCYLEFPDGLTGFVAPPYTGAAQTDELTIRAKGDAMEDALTKQDIDIAALKTKEWPSELQKVTGLYPKGKVGIRGVPVTIETRAGSWRTGEKPDGTYWQSLLKNHYGYIDGTEGGDGAPLDCFLADDPMAPNAYVIDQVHPRTGQWDEHKVVLGANGADEARQVYRQNYPEGWRGCADVTEMPVDDFKQWYGRPKNLQRPLAPYLEPNDSGVAPPIALSAGIDEATPQGGKRGDYADPQNKGFPLNSKKRVKAALSYYNAGAGKEQRSDDEWAAIGRKIAAKATSTFGMKHELKGGKIEHDEAPGGKADSEIVDLLGKIAQHVSGRADDAGAMTQANLNNQPTFLHEEKPKADEDVEDGPLSTPVTPTADAPETIADILTPTDGMDDPQMDSLRAVAAAIGHYGGFGHLWWNGTDAVAWEHGENDGTGDTTPLDEIQRRFALVDGVARVELLREASPGDGWTKLAYRSVVDVAGRPCIDSLTCVGDCGFRIMTDSEGRMRVRQLLTMADAVNDNRRLYRRNVLKGPLEDAGRRARDGLLTMELKHPEAVRLKRGDVRYVDNHDRKTAVLNDIEAIGSDGSVYGTFTIANTPHGKEIAQAYRDAKNGKGDAPGISMRFFSDEPHEVLIGGQYVDVPSQMEIATFDHVYDPAVRQTKTQFRVMNDSQLAALDGSTTTCDTTTVAEASTDATGGRPRMNPITQELNKLRGLLAIGADPNQITASKATIKRLMQDAIDKGEDVTPHVDAMDKMGVSAYRSGAPTPEPLIAGLGEAAISMGYAPDARHNIVDPGPSTLPSHAAQIASLQGIGAGTPGMDANQLKMLMDLADRQIRQDQEAARLGEIQAQCDSVLATNDALKALSADEQEYILSTVRKTAKTPAEVSALVDSTLSEYMKLASKRQLQGMGYAGFAQGQTINDPSNPLYTAQTHVSEGHPVLDEAFKHLGQGPGCMNMVSRILHGADDYTRKVSIQDADPPDDPKTIARRVANVRAMFPLMDEIAQKMSGDNTKGMRPMDVMRRWFQKCDQLTGGGKELRPWGDNVQAAADALGNAGTDSMTMANLFNQPTLLMALFIQKLWDSRMFSTVQGYGPSVYQTGSNMAGWGNSVHNGAMGNVFRIPMLYRDYVNMTGYAGKPQRQFDPGFLVPENTGINGIQDAIFWAEFGPQVRTAALQITREALLAIGNGPLNLDMLGYGLWSCAHEFMLRLDLAIANEHALIADEYLATVVTAGSPETPNYTNNSVYPASGAVTVNLNASKTAVFAVAATDDSITYGTGVVGAIRLACAGTAASGPYYYGDVSGFGPAPILRTRTLPTLSAPGQLSTSTANPAAAVVTGGTGAVATLGYMDDTGAVQTFPGGGTTANYAFDYARSVMIFTAGFTALAASGGIAATALSSTVALNYSYATNYDNLPILQAYNSPPSGQTRATVLDAVLQQITFTAANMSGPAAYGKYMPPNLLICSMNAAPYITNAQIFYQIASPKGTELGPTPDYFGVREDINMMRHNAPWFPGDRRLQLTTKGATKYGVEEPQQFRGPQFANDSSGNPINREQVITYEKSFVGTPQITDQSGNILNPVGRSILLR